MMIAGEGRGGGQALVRNSRSSGKQSTTSVTSGQFVVVLLQQHR